jgi:hypothetical protein
MQCILYNIYFWKVFHMYYNLICNFICTPIWTKKIILVKSGCYTTFALLPYVHDRLALGYFIPTHPSFSSLKSNTRWDKLIPDIRNNPVTSLVGAQPNTPQEDSGGPMGARGSSGDALVGVGATEVSENRVGDSAMRGQRRT